MGGVSLSIQTRNRWINFLSVSPSVVGHPQSLDRIRIVHFPKSVKLNVAVHTIDHLLEKRIVPSRDPDDDSLRFGFFGRLDLPLGSFLSHGPSLYNTYFLSKGNHI